MKLTYLKYFISINTKIIYPQVKNNTPFQTIIRFFNFNKNQKKCFKLKSFYMKLTYFQYFISINTKIIVMKNIILLIAFFYKSFLFSFNKNPKKIFLNNKFFCMKLTYFKYFASINKQIIYFKTKNKTPNYLFLTKVHFQVLIKIQKTIFFK